MSERAHQQSGGVDPGVTVGTAGEAGALSVVLAQLGPAERALLGPGDDAAVLAPRGDLVVTTDTMVEGVDFRLAWHSGFELGWKLAATNLSDVAAMGARPIALTVAFACPSTTPVALLADISRGLDAACRVLAPGCGVVGGDLGRAPVLTAAVTALGDLEGRAAVRRATARVGDVVAYAGDLGLAGLGLRLLFAAEGRSVGELRADHPAAIEAQLAPQAPIHLGIIAAEAGATAMLDVSDGLALDAARIARASGVTIDFDPGRLAECFGEQRGEQVPRETMLHGGEDHGLLAAFPAEVALPEGFQRIGVVTARGSSDVLLGGSPLDARGWDPFAAAATDATEA